MSSCRHVVVRGGRAGRSCDRAPCRRYFTQSDASHRIISCHLIFANERTNERTNLIEEVEPLLVVQLRTMPAAAAAAAAAAVVRSAAGGRFRSVVV